MYVAGTLTWEVAGWNPTVETNLYFKNIQNTFAIFSYILKFYYISVSGKSVIHFITSPSQESTSTPKDIGKQLANRLASLRQYLKHTHLKLRPLSHTTLQHVGDLLPSLTAEKPVTMQDTVMAEPHPSPVLHRKGNGVGEGPEPKILRAGSSAKTKTKPAIKRSPLPTGNTWKKITPSRSRRNRMRGFAGIGNGGGVDTDSSTSEDTGYSDWMSNKGSLERDGKAQAAVTSDPGVVTSMMDYMLCDESPRLWKVSLHCWSSNLLRSSLCILIRHWCKLSFKFLEKVSIFHAQKHFSLKYWFSVFVWSPRLWTFIWDIEPKNNLSMHNARVKKLISAFSVVTKVFNVYMRHWKIK